MSEPTAQDKTTAAPDAAAQPATGTNAAMPKGADPNKPANGPAGRSTPLQVRANYENIPGQSKTGPKAAYASTALWFDPLTIASLSPAALETEDHVGVSRGGGQVIAVRPVPLHEPGEAGAGEGTGQLTAQLKYAAEMKDSYTVKVTGDFKAVPKGAVDQIKDFIAKKLATLGDLELVKQAALDYVAQEFADAKNVHILLVPNEKGNVLQDAGKTHVFYKARAKPAILLNVPVVAVADKQVTSGAVTTKHSGSDSEAKAHGNVKTDNVKVTDDKTETERHSEGAVQTHHDAYHDESTRVYQQIISAIQSRVDVMTQSLVQKLDADSTFHDDGKWEEHSERFTNDDYSKNNKTGSEEGDRPNKNWAAWVQDALGGVKKVIDLPFAKVLPGPVGKIIRRLNEFGLVVDLLHDAAGEFAVRGQVHYKDTHDDTEAHDKQHDKTDAKGEDHRTVTRNDKSTLTQELGKVATTLISSVTTTRGTDKTTRDTTRDGVSTQKSGGTSTKHSGEDYQSGRTQTDVGGEVTARANQSTTTEITWSQSVKETTTKPILQASVVDGDGEVSSTEFPAPVVK